MKLFAVLAFLLLTACACKPVADPYPAPDKLDQYRQVMYVENGSKEPDSMLSNYYAGVTATTKVDQKLYARTAREGDIDIRGLDDCGYYFGKGIAGSGWASFELAPLMDQDVCVFKLHQRTNDFDAPVSGLILVRPFIHADVVPLKLMVNNVLRYGAAAIQLAREKETQDNRIEVRLYEANKTVDENAGIQEKRSIEIMPLAKKGDIRITSNKCNYSNKYPFELTDTEPTIKTSLNDWFPKGIYNDICVFDITINSETGPKEAASVLVTTYTNYGSFLAAPSYSYDKLFKEMCFEFNDRAVVGVAVTYQKKGNWYTETDTGKKICVDKSDTTYTVEGITANWRNFWGVHDGTNWKEIL